MRGQTLSFWISLCISSSFKLSSKVRYCFLQFILCLWVLRLVWPIDRDPWTNGLYSQRYGPVAEFSNFQLNFPFGRELFSACLWDSLQGHHMIHLKLFIIQAPRKDRLCQSIDTWLKFAGNINSKWLDSISFQRFFDFCVCHFWAFDFCFTGLN